MPIYEYRCPECAARFEALVPSAAADEATCKTCGAPGQRLLSVFSAPRSAGGDGAAMPASGGCCGGACGHC